MNKLFSLLGLAMRAGKIVSGEELVLKEVRSGKAQLVLLAIDAAKNTEKKVSDKCSTYQIPILRYGTRHELGNAIGKAERVVIAITDSGFSRSMQKLVQ
ncbi:YlxQ family RNA-binding protein [Hazenella coriacea]|uniref:Ribosomal protein L7Ae-like RNA K-turn-binding protein n=1 Tax=Hazenella coriacea TaxID=1179467 RepID=A0A4R3L1S5_9BACL|nr:YlxQ family RNA-binding protein [Hazenella coriacea]TCS92546.1 ribosomal protein L7Ae-like RNA K-turn-binding protein [Hazenella coriacea]